MLPSRMIKLKEGWGEAKKESEGEDEGPPTLVPLLYASKMAAF